MNIIQTNMNPLTFTQHPAPQPRHRVAGLHVIQESLSRLTCATMEVPGGLLWFHQDPGGSEFSIQWGPVLGESKNPVIVHLEQFPPYNWYFPGILSIQNTHVSFIIHHDTICDNSSVFYTDYKYPHNGVEKIHLEIHSS